MKKYDFSSEQEASEKNMSILELAVEDIYHEMKNMSRKVAIKYENKVEYDLIKIDLKQEEHEIKHELRDYLKEAYENKYPVVIFPHPAGG